MKLSKALSAPNVRSFGVFLAQLAVVLSVLFAASFDPSKVHFSNDNPLGMLNARWLSLPQSFWGAWYDINWLGFNEGSSILIPSNLLRMVLGAVYYSKFYAPLTLLFFGCCAWVFFRCLGFAPSVCAIGGFAAALGSNYFSIACYGIGTQTVAFGFDFLALAAVLSAASGRHRWVKLALAGLAVGMGVMEGVDNGAIFSLFVAAFTLFTAFTEAGPLPRRLAQGMAQVGVVAVFAALIAAQALTVLINTQIKGVAGMEQDAATRAKRWDEATQWSLPKCETLSLVIPGLFGYRMDGPEGGVYWGGIGREPAWDRYFKAGGQGPRPAGILRRVGTGIYAGVGVALVGLWAVLQSLRKQGSVFSLAERKFLWFWSGAAIVSLLLAFGRFAPFYQVIYALPYASTFRNPGKFASVFNWALLILFASGVQGLTRRYMGGVQNKREAPANSAAKSWWAAASVFDRRWVIGCTLAIGASLAGWRIYSSSRSALIRYLETVPVDGATPESIVQFSNQQVGWFVLFLALAATLVTAILSGAFAGRRAKWGAMLLGALVVADLARANLPWIIHWDYKEKYATNPVIDLLREHPWEQRVAILPGWLPQAFRVPEQFLSAEGTLDGLYRIEWAQHHFPYYDIQSLDIIQMPRPPVDYVAFEMALQPGGTQETVRRVVRRWQLTNTRYLLGVAEFLPLLDQGLDGSQHRFRIVKRFGIAPRPGIARPTSYEQLDATDQPNGPYALFEFTGALPRAKLYSSWLVSTNDQATLEKLSSADFDPTQTVLVANPLPASPTNATASPGSVTIASYAPTRVVLRTKGQSPALLLLNDKFDPQWRVMVDGQPAALLRCNYVMRGVQIPQGEHEVDFRFAPPINTIYVSLGGMLLGLALLGFLAFSEPTEAAALSAAASQAGAAKPILEKMSNK